MKDKASQKTEDEVLDQTFGGDQTFDGFDEEMTSQTQDEAKTGSSAPVKKKSSGSSNTLLFVAGGVAAVGIIAYMFVLKPMIAPAPVPARSPVQEQAVVPELAPVTPPVSVPVAPVVTPERQVATDFLTGNNSVPPVTSGVPVVAQVAAPVAPIVPPVTASVPVAPVVTPVTPVAPTLPVIPEVSASNGSSASIVEELGRKFDSQGQQFRIALDDVGNKVTNLEKFRETQLGVNKNVDERLTKLEGGKLVKVTRDPVKSVSSETAPVIKKAPVKVSKPVREMREPRESRDYRNVLVDKTEERSPKETKVKEPGVDYNVHSIYGGRVWLKNSDGSLSTYTSGDRLPSGELIKSVDDEKYLINTDKRSFKK